MTEESKLFCEFIYCGCGCGKTRAPTDIRGRSRKYLYGHSMGFHDKTEMILCACGCGQTRTRYSKHGTEKKFIRFHSCRVLSKSMDKHPMWRGGTTRSTGYVKILKPDHHFADPYGYVPEHRLVYEKHYKCSLLSWIEVHHKNHIRDDNRIDNLQPVTKLEHGHLHRQDLSIRYCCKCGRTETSASKLRNRNYIHYYWYKDLDSPDKWNCNKCYHKRKK